jgi:protein SCO1/2
MNRWCEFIRCSAFGRRRAVGIVVAIALAAGAQLAAAGPLPVAIGGPFTLVASDGTMVTDRTYRGKWLLVYFGYTFCPDICPTTLVEIATALEKLGPDAVNVQPIFITVDPQRDTPDVMADYTRSFDARIVGLTGDPHQIAIVAKAYGAYFDHHQTGPGAQDYVVDHSTYVYLMDARGQFVRGFDADTPGARIADAVRRLMTQAREGEGHAEPPG